MLSRSLEGRPSICPSCRLRKIGLVHILASLKNCYFIWLYFLFLSRLKWIFLRPTESYLNPFACQEAWRGFSLPYSWIVQDRLSMMMYTGAPRRAFQLHVTHEVEPKACTRRIWMPLYGPCVISEHVHWPQHRH